MKRTFDIQKMDAEIRRLRSAAETLSRLSGDFPSVAGNTARILASVKMLELNVSDFADLDNPE